MNFDGPLPPSFIEIQVLLATICWINGSILTCAVQTDRHGVTLGPEWVATDIRVLLAQIN